MWDLEHPIIEMRPGRVIPHEFGHALGLDHYPGCGGKPEESSVMNCCDTAMWPTLNDQAALGCVYAPVYRCRCQ